MSLYNLQWWGWLCLGASILDVLMVTAHLVTRTLNVHHLWVTAALITLTLWMLTP